MWKRWTQWTEAEESLIGFGLFRIVVGFMVWRHTWAFVRRYVYHGFYRDTFYPPYWDWYPLPSETAYLLLMVAMMLAGLFIIIGYKTRWALIGGLAVVGFHLFLNQFWYGYNRYFLFLCLVLLCVSPCDHVFSLDAQKTKRDTRGPNWSGVLIRLQITLIYLASAVSKTLDADWRSGRVLWDRAVGVIEQLRQTGQAPDGILAEKVLELLSNRRFWELLVPLIISIEYFLAVALWLPWTRRLALWVGLIFHAYIEVGDRVLAFSYLSLGTYFFFISPHQQNRIFCFNPNHPRHQFWAKWLKRLDWFDKVRFVAHDSPALRIQDVDGRWYVGRMAVCIAGAAMVLPYLIAYPLTWLRFFGVGRIDVKSVPEGATPHFQLQMQPSRARLILALLMPIYIGFLWAVTTIPAIRLEFSAAKFVDIPVMFLLFALMIAAAPKP
jgi:uncharacterized membrane protein YphA (DoxX/SURF4 family)